MGSLVRREDASMTTTVAHLPVMIDDENDLVILPPIRKETVGLIGLCVAAAIVAVIVTVVYFAMSSKTAANLQHQAEAHAADMERLNATLTDLAEAIQLQQAPQPAPEPVKVEPSAVEKASNLISPEMKKSIYAILGVLAFAIVIASLNRLDPSGFAAPFFCVAALVVLGMIFAR